MKPAPATPRPGWWERRIRQPIITQLTQGVSVEKITLTLTLGATLGVFPILGATTFLSGIAAWLLKLNQPIIQAVTLLAYPVQCALLIPFYRAGERMFDAPRLPLSISMLISRFMENTGQFLRDYGLTGVHGIVVWACTAPFIGIALFFPLRRLLNKVARLCCTPK